MPSISHLTDLRQEVLHRAKSGRTTLPVRMIHGALRRTARAFVQWVEDWRALRHLGELDEYLLRDIGLTDVDAHWSIIRRPPRPDSQAPNPKP